MKHGSLFSGIGGFDLAAEWMGWQNVFHCEWNEFGQKVLHYHFPNSISYNDITQTDFTIHRGRIDILTGGFPCQPYSGAGKRLGKEDDRHLWPEMLRAIREIQPTWVVGENVLGLVNWNGGLVFDEVQADLEAQGYEIQPYVLPACAVNAPHRRDRVWFIAFSKTAKNTLCSGRLFGESEQEGTEIRQLRYIGARSSYRIYLSKGNDSNANNERLERDAGKRIQGDERGRKSIQNGKFAGLCQQSDWRKFPTQSPICSRNDGVSYKLDGITFSKWRNESIKAYGNAVVPQVVYQIFKSIEQYNFLSL
jgi:DNA (cytosine-5)-methyltransferase 1